MFWLAIFFSIVCIYIINRVSGFLGQEEHRGDVGLKFILWACLGLVFFLLVGRSDFTGWVIAPSLVALCKSNRSPVDSPSIWLSTPSLGAFAIPSRESTIVIPRATTYTRGRILVRPATSSMMSSLRPAQIWAG